MRHYTYSILVACTLLIVACNGNQPSPEAGGPCFYKETRIRATVVSVVAIDSQRVEVDFKLDSNDFLPPPNDTVSYYLEMGKYLTPQECSEYQVDTGKAFTYLVREIETGSCSPFLKQLVLQEPMQ